jgi:ATP/maltotriose-dependent transcriptional regulator MalT
VHTVLGWLYTLPTPLAQTHPLLNVIHAGAFVLMNELAAAERRVEVAEQTLPADPQDDRARAILGTTLLTRAYIAFFRGDLAHWLTLSRRVLELLPPTDVIGRPAANLDMASDFFVSGDVTLGNERRLVAAVAAVRASGHFITLSRSIVSLAELQRRQGRLRHAATTYGEAVHALPDPVMLQAVPSGAAYYFGLGDVRREWNDLAAAEPLLTQGRAMVQGGLVAEASSIVAGYRALARLHQARGDARSAQATLAELAEVARQRTFVDHLHARVTAVGAQVALDAGAARAGGAVGRHQRPAPR